MSTPENSVIRRVVQRLPLVSRLAATLMVVTAAAIDSQPAHSQKQASNNSDSISSQETNPYVDYFIDSLGRSRRLETIVGTNGISPNNSDNLISTIADSIQDAPPILYQVSELIYPSNSRKSIAIERKYLDRSFNIIYLATSTAFNTNLNTGYPRIAAIGDANNPTNYSNHFLFPIDALPQGGIVESDVYESFAMKEDVDGKYLDVGLNKYGSWRVRLDKDGRYVKTEVRMSKRAFLGIVGNSFTGK